jgi:Cu-processing system ATP-binding protein
LSKSFGKLQVLKKVQVSFQAGQCVSLIGPNGSGKTTLIKCILGLVLPDQGDVIFDEKSILQQHEHRVQFGYMPQSANYPGHMNIGQVIDMMRDIRGARHTDEELMEEFRLRDLYSKKMNTLSGGTRQKVNAALAFLFDPRVLILDEPTAGLDPVASEILKNKIQRSREKGKLILLTSHILSDLDELVTEVVYIQEGKILYQDTINSLREKTGEVRLSTSIARIMKESGYV